MRNLLVILMVGAVLWGVSGIAAAQPQTPPEPNRALISLGAYKGITFNNMFDEMKSGSKGMSMGTMILMIKSNLQAMETDPALTYEKQRIGDILTAIAEVETELTADPPAAQKAVREYYTTDQEPNHNKFVKKLKDKNFENLGLSFPFLGFNGQNRGHGQFKQFLDDHKNFLDVLGGMCYADFYLHTADEPWVTDSVIDLLIAMHKVKPFGSIHTYMTDPVSGGQVTEVSPDTMWAEYEKAANNMCCDRYTRKCVIYNGMNCLICNPSTSACCFGQPWCP